LLNGQAVRKIKKMVKVLKHYDVMVICKMGAVAV
jgi:hypothetical protein